MSDSAAKESGATNPRAVVADAASASVAESSTDSSFGEHNLSFTTTDLSLVEMTEIEYTQLQHILYSHMEAQAIDNESENRPHSNGFPTNNSANQTQYLTSCSNSQSGLSSNSSGNQSLCPIICQSGLASDSSFMGASNQCLGHIDFQELRMMLLSESSLLPSQAEKTPNSGSVDTSGQSLLKVRHNENLSGINKENTLAENSAPVSEARAKSAVRVRLEDRFNNIQTDMPRCQETQEAGVSINNLVTLIRHSPEVMGVPLHQQQNKCTALVKNKTTAATTTTALQFTCPLFNPNTAPPANGNANPSQSQNSGPSVLEAAKHQDLALPRAFSICYQQEIEATKQTVGPRNKSVPEHVWIKLGEEHLCKQTINKRSRSRIHPLETNVQRKPLGDIQNMCDNQSAGPAQGTWHAAQPNQNISSGNPGGVSQRRERHNRMERDRRRRIRICCDELNLLVPFCTSDTDKATTLQWTTAFLKYIQERHGDSLKKEFETVFCGKTGRRLKLTRPDSLGTCPPQEIAQSSTSMEIK